MQTKWLLRKLVNQAINLTIILLASAELAVACEVVQGSTVIEDNNFLAKVYLGLSLIILAVVSLLYFLPKRSGLVCVVICALVVLLHPGWRFRSGGDCGSSTVELAKWLFIWSLVCLVGQCVLKMFKQRIRQKV